MQIRHLFNRTDFGQVNAMAGIATARRRERLGCPRARQYPSSRGVSDISDSAEAQEAGSTPIRSIDPADFSQISKKRVVLWCLALSMLHRCASVAFSITVIRV